MRTNSRNLWPAAAVVAITLLVAAMGGSATAAPLDPAPTSATVTIVHGLRGQLIDVYLDGRLLLKGFQPERVTDPLQSPAGDHRVELRPAGSSADAVPVAAATVTVEPGANLSLVAHLDGARHPTITKYVNDTSPVAPGKGRLVARNSAASAPVSVVINGAPAVTALVTDGEFHADVAPATYQVAVKDPVGATIVPANDVPVPAAASTIMYLIGSQTDNNLIWIGQTISGLTAPPTVVKTGNSGLAAPHPDRTTGLLVGGAIGAVLAAGSAAVVRRRCRRWAPLG